MTKNAIMETQRNHCLMDPIYLQHALLWAIMCIDIVIASYILVQNPRHAVHATFFLMVFGATLWGVGLVLILTTKIFIFNQVIFWGGTIVVLGFVLFAKVFPGESVLPKRSLLHCIPLFLLFVGIPFNVFVSDISITPEGELTPVNGPLFPAYIFVMGAYMSYGLFLLSRTYRSASGAKRMQMYYMITGFTIFIISAFIFDILLPGLQIFQLNLFGPMASIALIGLTALAIIRHQLMDIRIIIQRGLVGSVLLGLIVALYLIILMFVSFFFTTDTSVQPITSALITTLLCIGSVPILRAYFTRITDPFFFKDTYDYGEAMEELSKLLQESMTLEEITKKTSEALKKILRADSVTYVLYKKETVTHEDGLSNENNAALRIPIIFRDRTTGMLTCGKKRSGDPYGPEDIQLLKTFAYQAAVSIEKARLYEEVKKHSELLEIKVAERTRELEILQEGERQMMADIAHGLQTPLTILMSETRKLTHGSVHPKDVQTFEQSIDTMSKFIYDLLLLARLEHANTESKPESVDLSALLEDIAEYVEVTAAEQNIRIIASITPKIFVFGFKDQLSEAIVNLLSNAIKYMRSDGKRSVSIGLGIEQTRVVLTVCDTGIGISEDDISHIFERFYRAKNNAHRSARGTGLGLAITKRIIEKHNGDIHATSILGQETTFTVTLPRLLSE